MIEPNRRIRILHSKQDKKKQIHTFRCVELFDFLTLNQLIIRNYLILFCFIFYPKMQKKICFILNKIVFC